MFYGSSFFGQDLSCWSASVSTNEKNVRWWSDPACVIKSFILQGVTGDMLKCLYRLDKIFLKKCLIYLKFTYFSTVPDRPGSSRQSDAIFHSVSTATNHSTVLIWNIHKKAKKNNFKISMLTWVCWCRLSGSDIVHKLVPLTSMISAYFWSDPSPPVTTDKWIMFHKR